ncbi:MAG: hypothetical protein A4E67_00416 [Syntrophaceae bacterium PtaB.Bin038]|nr:MAG: hypothetical protein A4E67_00416 [Syntrophaceae bacterium PtaB.Bin038]
MPTTTNFFIRGTMPMGVAIPWGETTWTASWRDAPTWRASSFPRTMPGTSAGAPGAFISRRPCGERFSRRPSSIRPRLITSRASAGERPLITMPLTLSPCFSIAWL